MSTPVALKLSMCRSTIWFIHRPKTIGIMSSGSCASRRIISATTPQIMRRDQFCSEPNEWCITFGSFSEVTKISPAAVARWAAGLRAMPDARFLLNGHLLSDGARQGRIISMFMDERIGTDRVLFLTGGPHVEFLARYSEVDIILDTSSYSGGLTTCESLLTRVPVLTVTGEGRHGWRPPMPS